MHKVSRKKIFKKSNFNNIDDVLEFLYSNNYLRYGITIPTSVFESIIGESFKNHWSWRGPFLVIKDAIEKEGFFCTQRGLAEDDVKILSPDEVAFHAYKRQKKRHRHVKKDHRIVQKTDISSLDNEKKKIHLHELRRLSQAVLRIAEVMEKDFT